jgi:lipoprotein-anchoring transpeptidase ErfK/SrfK
MNGFLAFLCLISPLWPLGENPLPGDPYIIINKNTNQLAFINHNEIQHIYPVGTGKSKELTPEGEFTIIVKAVNPYYRKKDIPGGVKENPLGTRWIGFDADGTNGRIYGIHGNNNPKSIGRYVSAGCVRMREGDVQTLYDEVPLGTKVLILSSQHSFEELAKTHGAITKMTKHRQETS